MALLTSCQHTFQNVVAYEDALDDVEILKIQVHDCYSEIAKTADEITSTVHDTYIEKTQLETIPMYSIYLEPPIVSIIGFVIFANYVTSFKFFDDEIIISVL